MGRGFTVPRGAVRRPETRPLAAPPARGPAEASAPVRGHVAGHIVGVAAGRWLVDYPGNPHGPLPARTTLHPAGTALRHAAAVRAEALLVFEREQGDKPVVVGLLSPPVADVAAAAHRTGLGAASADAGAMGVAEVRPEAGVYAEPLVDGERVVCTARDELVLRCGKASIQLLSDGTVRVRGTNLLSRASVANRIRGAHVQIN